MNNEKWNLVAPGFEPFWGIVSQSGKVIALRLASEDIAKQICDEHNNMNQNDVSANLCAKCEKPMVISHVCVNTDCDRCVQ